MVKITVVSECRVVIIADTVVVNVHRIGDTYHIATMDLTYDTTRVRQSVETSVWDATGEVIARTATTDIAAICEAISELEADPLA